MSNNSATTILDESEVYILTPADIEPILLDHAQHNEPCFILGDPGCGKTSMVEAAANAVGKPMLFPYNLSQADGTEFGVPDFVTTETGRVLKFTQEDHWHFRAANQTTVFFDEWAQGNVLTQCAATPILRENRVRSVYLHPSTWRVGASNFPKNKCGTNRIPSHTLNNLPVYGLAYHAESQINYMLAQPDCDLLTVRYLRMKGDSAFFFDPANTINATPRQWTNVAKKLYRNPTTHHATIAGMIGKGNASELMEFRALVHELPSPEEVLLNPTAARVPDKVSAQFLVTDMMADQSSVGTFDALVTYAKRLPPEMQAKFVKDSMKRKPEVAGTKAFVDWGVKFAEVLR